MGKVYFVSANVPITYLSRVPRSKWHTHSLVYQTKQLAGKILEDTISTGDTVAVKIHFGERYTRCYIRPIYVRQVVEKIKELGGKPFVCDTLFSGGRVLHDETGEAILSRRSLEDGLETATMNGFTSETMNCPVLFADAPKGLRSVEYETNGKYIRKVHIAPAIAEADILLSLAHFKCHDCMGIGGALKNVGVGCSSKRGKWWIHHKDRLEITSVRCNGCEDCLSACPAEAIILEDSKARIITEKCVDCGFCIDYCSRGAFTSRSFPNIEEQEARIAESAAGIVKYFDGRCGFVNLAIDITPLCDCDPFVGIPIVPDLGVLASRDPVALDRACVDLVNTSLGVPTSMADSADAMGKGMDKINSIAKMRWEAAPGATHVSPDWKVMLKAAEEANLGTQRYRLVKVNFGHPPRNVEDLFSEYEKRKKA